MKLAIAFSLIALAINLQFDMHINDAVPNKKLRILNETKHLSHNDIESLCWSPFTVF